MSVSLTNSPTLRLASLASAIVTGSSSGLGRGIALALAAAGVRLIICADICVDFPSIEEGSNPHTKSAPQRPNIPTHELIASRFSSVRAIFMRCDVGLETKDATSTGEVLGWEEVVEQAVSLAGRLDL